MPGKWISRHQVPPGKSPNTQSERRRRKSCFAALTEFVCSTPITLQVCQGGHTKSCCDSAITAIVENEVEQLEEGLRVHVILEDEDFSHRSVTVRIEVEDGPITPLVIDDISDGLRGLLPSLDRTSGVSLEVSRCYGGVLFKLSTDLNEDSLDEIRRFLGQVDIVSGVRPVDAAAPDMKLC